MTSIALYEINIAITDIMANWTHGSSEVKRPHHDDASDIISTPVLRTFHSKPSYIARAVPLTIISGERSR